MREQANKVKQPNDRRKPYKQAVNTPWWTHREVPHLQPVKHGNPIHSGLHLNSAMQIFI